MVFYLRLRRMGATIENVNRREKSGEVFGNLRIKSSKLLGRRFGQENLANMKEELPLLLAAAACGETETIIRGISFLRQFQVDFLKSMIHNLRDSNLEIGEIEDGSVIRGGTELDGGQLNCFNNPVVALAYLVLGMRSHGDTFIENFQILDEWYPGLLNQLSLNS